MLVTYQNQEVDKIQAALKINKEANIMLSKKEKILLELEENTKKSIVKT